MRWCDTSRIFAESTRPVSPVIFHQLPGPFRLTQPAFRLEFLHDRLDVEDRRAVNRVQVPDGEFSPPMCDELHRANAERVGPILFSLREDANQAFR